jgi:hypothetical protein
MRLCLALLLLVSFQKEAGVFGKIAAPEGTAQKRLRTKLSGSDVVAGHKDPDPTLAAVWLEGVAPTKVESRTAVIPQEGLEFRPRVLALGMGSKLEVTLSVLLDRPADRTAGAACYDAR